MEPVKMGTSIAVDVVGDLISISVDDGAFPVTALMTPEDAERLASALMIGIALARSRQAAPTVERFTDIEPMGVSGGAGWVKIVPGCPVMAVRP